MAETKGPNTSWNFGTFIRRHSGTLGGGKVDRPAEWPPPPDPLPSIQRFDEQPSGEEIILPIEEAAFRVDETSLTSDGTGTLGDAVEIGATPAELNCIGDVTINDGHTLGSAMITDLRIPRTELENMKFPTLALEIAEERMRRIVREMMDEMLRTPGMTNRDIGIGSLVGKEEKDPRKKKEGVRKIIL